MDRQKGSLTIEATIALVSFFIIFFAFTSLGQYTETQNKVHHALNQTAVSMSARNFQLSKLQGALKTATSADLSQLSDTIGMFSNFDTNELGGVGKQLHLPYTTESTYYDSTKYIAWTSDSLKQEAARMFAYYFMDLDFNASKNLTFDEIKSKIEEQGIKNFEMNGCGKNSKIIDGGTLYLEISYTIDTAFSFDTIFGNGNFMKFSDEVSMKLMK